MPDSFDRLTEGPEQQPTPGTGDDGWSPILPVPDDEAAGPPPHANGEPTANWAYRDDARNLLGFVCRWDRGDGKVIRPATFCRHADGRRQWRWKMWPEPRPLYGRDRLAARPTAPVLVVEGEKAADAATELFPEFVAVTSPGGAKATAKADWSPFAGRAVIVWPDADEPGARYAEDVAREAAAAGAASVRIVRLPAELPPGWDLADAPPAGWDVDKLRSLLVSDAPAYARGGGSDDPAPDGEPRKKRTDGGGPREDLIAIGDEVCEFWHDPDGEPYATVSVDGHRENHALSSPAFRRLLQREYGRRHPRTCLNGRKAPGGVGKAAVDEAIDTLAAMAHAGPEHEPVVRVGGSLTERRIYVDLGGPDWRAVEITPQGWRIVSDPPVKFIRPRGLRALPEPVKGGALLDDLRPFVNVASDDALRWLAAFLVQALRPPGSGPYWLLVIDGEQGTGKSALFRTARALIDPNEAPIRAAPKDEEGLVLSAKGGWLLAFDNLSSIRPDFADALCRLLTGGGFSRRKNFSHEEWLTHVCRPAMLNSIGNVVTRGDLADRCLTITLEPIPKARRKPEKRLEADFQACRPRLLGALYDAVALALGRLPEVEQTLAGRLPRMADATLFACAAAPAWGSTEEEMLALIEANARAAAAAPLEASLLTELVRSLVREHGLWTGTATELLEKLARIASDETKRSREWPRDATRLSGHLKRLAPVLRAIGVDVQFGRVHGGARRIIIRRCEPEGSDTPGDVNEGLGPVDDDEVVL